MFCLRSVNKKKDLTSHLFELVLSQKREVHLKLLLIILYMTQFRPEDAVITQNYLKKQRHLKEQRKGRLVEIQKHPDERFF